MAHPLQAHYDCMTALLRPLRTVFDSEPRRDDERKHFDEFLAHNELGLALHVVCDFLLSLPCSPVDASILERIENAHLAMELKDDSVARLRLIPPCK